MNVVLMSFGFKQELTPQAELVFDVRFLKNPHYDPALQAMTGLDAEVGVYVESDPDFAEFYAELTALLTLLLRRYAEKKSETITIAIGCTGGRHRSVYIVQKLGAFLQGSDYNVTLRHRDLENT